VRRRRERGAKGGIRGAADEKARPADGESGEVRIGAHSMLFYWWPVWAAGFLMAGVTWLDGYRLAVVPRDGNRGRH
jgi:hypothetical protein